ncbi:MAG: peptidase M41, partial [Flavobacteriales bacterium]|nr:peptidase M41 [Flavobacteriales bacterium]
IEEQYQRAIDILSANKDKLTRLAEQLLEKEVIFKEDLEAIFGPRPFEEGVKKEVAAEEKTAGDIAVVENTEKE